MNYSGCSTPFVKPWIFMYTCKFTYMNYSKGIFICYIMVICINELFSNCTSQIIIIIHLLMPYKWIILCIFISLMYRCDIAQVIIYLYRPKVKINKVHVWCTFSFFNKCFIWRFFSYNLWRPPTMDVWYPVTVTFLYLTQNCLMKQIVDTNIFL